MSKFLRFHNHSKFSARDGMLSLELLIDEANKVNEATSITDHGSIAGLLKFNTLLKEKNLKGGYGCEFYLNKHIKRLQELRSLIAQTKDKELLAQYKEERENKKKGNHLVVLAKNTHGFYNLIKLNNIAYIEGFYNKPYIDYNDLFSMEKDENGDYGVIISSACLAGPASRYILDYDEKEAVDWILLMKEYFKDDFYLEVQVNNLDEQKKVNQALVTYSEEYNIPLIVGTDAHYLNYDWVETHKDLLLLQTKSKRKDLGKFNYTITYENKKGEEKTRKLSTGQKFREGKTAELIEIGNTFGKGSNIITITNIKKTPKAWEFNTQEAYYKSEKQIREDIHNMHHELIPYEEKIISGNYEVYDKLEDIEINKELKLPKIENAYSELVSIIKENLANKINELNLNHEETQAYIDRIRYELDIIKRFDFAEYFYILYDALQYAFQNDLPIGAGRGSVSSSLVAYLLGIHRINPMDPKWGHMSFTRFLDADRGKYPDIDSDIGARKLNSKQAPRDELIDYLISKYGSENVAYVGTVLEYSAKSAIRDLSTVHNIPPGESIKCTKNYNMALDVYQNIDSNKDIREFFSKYPDLLDRVDRLEGVLSGLGIHAGGVVITDKKFPINKYCPVQRSKDDGRIATLWTKEEIEGIGLVKYDFLGLNSASQIHYARKFIGLDPYKDHEEDIEVFRNIVLNKKNQNIFQFESAIGQRAFEDLMPMSIMELANASGIIRILSSPEGRNIYNQYKENIEFIQQGDVNYWKRKLREEVIDNENYEIVVDVLKDSYGVLIYQEQLAELVSRLSRGKISFGAGDVFRRYLDKKHRKKYGTLGENQGNPQALKKWHKAYMELLNEYVIPYLGKDLYVPGVQDFIEGNLDKNNNLITPEYGIVSWIISSSVYLFNKLHSIAYSTNSYSMMWLKHYYPMEFWLASLQLEDDSLDKVRNYISAIKIENKDIKILPPDINKSDITFTVDKNKKRIRYGLRSIMNLGDSAYPIVQERKTNGKFKNAKDFITRLKGKRINKRIIENLIFVNAFSSWGTMEEVWQQFYEAGKELKEPETNEARKASIENRLIGINLSFKHPIVEQAYLYMPIDQLQDGDQNINIAVRIIESKTKQSKNGKMYNFMKVECLNTGVVSNVFDWTNKTYDDFVIMKVSKRNGFISVSNFSGGNKYKNKKFKNNNMLAAARKALM